MHAGSSLFRQDAIPKKRGPKTDVLEALLKRVNGLEKRLKDEQKSASPEGESSSPSTNAPQIAPQDETEVGNIMLSQKRPFGAQRQRTHVEKKQLKRWRQTGY